MLLYLHPGLRRILILPTKYKVFWNPCPISWSSLYLPFGQGILDACLNYIGVCTKIGSHRTFKGWLYFINEFVRLTCQRRQKKRPDLCVCSMEVCLTRPRCSKEPPAVARLVRNLSCEDSRTREGRLGHIEKKVNVDST